MLLDLIPDEAKFFTCLDLKNAFFCIGQAPQSQPIFAFQWESPSTGEKRHTPQYIDDFLLAGPTQEDCVEETHLLLSFLWKAEFKVS
jgi:hypothetical protein